MWGWSTRFGWGDVALGVLLLVIVVGLLLVAWWPTRRERQVAVDLPVLGEAK